ncbi:hypothetical protein [Aliiglaciecola sp. M165]|uniref:hypothetical protein n=1 Tax=Aliiglaciecola sp. M165 TaxID=2593649 RepID=UPI00117DFB17|nr:hypothetical protein [Aliiglaciecola sp. M165]TRY28681.1 hypothetical protein FM019_20690 [Aliiglaciecola sp. M165]
MKYLIFLLALTSAPSYSQDESFRNEIVGTWVVGRSDEYFNKEWFTTQYFADGTALYKQFETRECISPVLIIKGAWSIKGGKLINTVLSSSGDYDVPVGMVFVDNIVELNSGKMVLFTDTNRTAYREKHETCI